MAAATRRAILGAGLSLAATSASAGVNLHRAKKSPDADLLTLCATLEKMRAEWQRLYDATSEEDELTTPADFAWRNYSDHVWPLVHSNSFTAPAGVVDYPAKLLTLRATTPEGIQAKAAAIVAMDEASSYCDGRDDSYALCLSLLRDAASITPQLPGVGSSNPR